MNQTLSILSQHAFSKCRRYNKLIHRQKHQVWDTQTSKPTSTWFHLSKTSAKISWKSQLWQCEVILYPKYLCPLVADCSGYHNPKDHKTQYTNKVSLGAFQLVLSWWCLFSSSSFKRVGLGSVFVVVYGIESKQPLATSDITGVGVWHLVWDVFQYSALWFCCELKVGMWERRTSIILADVFYGWCSAPMMILVCVSAVVETHAL